MGRYAALSYCWGGDQDSKTTTENLTEYEELLPLSTMPRTIMDATELTRELGIPFLWVDSLCIIQDNKADKQKEIGNMAEVYKNSWVTISAARAASSQDGFLGPQSVLTKSETNFATLPIAFPGGTMGKVSLYTSPFCESRWGSPLWSRGSIPTLERAWTHQEFILSPRVVSYFDNGTELTCQAGTQSHDGLQPYLPEHFSEIEGRNPTLPYVFRTIQNSTISSEEKAQLQSLWYIIVTRYSSTHTTYPDDRLPALSALASEFTRVTGDTYLAGLWKCTIIEDLAWRVVEPLESTVRMRSGQKYAVPSWSWASVSIGVSFLHAEFHNPEKPYSLHADLIGYDIKDAPFGCVDKGRLIFRGLIKRVSIDLSSSHNLEERLSADLKFPSLEGVYGQAWLDDNWATSGTDRREFRQGEEESQNLQQYREELWRFKLYEGMSDSNGHEERGLILEKIGQDCYARVGAYGITYKGQPPKYWNDDFIEKTVVIE